MACCCFCPCPPWPGVVLGLVWGWAAWPGGVLLCWWQALLELGCGQQPRAPSQQFPWQPSHPASSLQCQKIKQDDTAAPQKNPPNHPNLTRIPSLKTPVTCPLPSPCPKLLAPSSCLPPRVSGGCLGMPLHREEQKAPSVSSGR